MQEISTLILREIVVSIILIAVSSYLLGSLNFGVIVSNHFAKDDVRNHGSGNAGTTNMLRNYGKKLALITILGDMAKVGVSILIALAILYLLGIKGTIEDYCGNSYLVYVKSFAGFFCVLGHIFPCYFKFKGGKGVATSGGMVLAIDWRIGLILLLIFVIIVALTRYVSLGSIIIAVLYPVLIFAFYQSFILTVIAIVFTLIVIISHRENLKKLINHTENKISFKKSKE